VIFSIYFLPHLLNDTKNLGLFGQAIVDTNKAIEINPESAELYVVRSQTYLALEDDEKAMDDCNRSLALDPKNAIAYSIRGVINAKLGNIDEARSNCEKAILLEPNNPVLYLHYALALFFGDLTTNGPGDLSRSAIEKASRAIDIDSLFSEAYVIRGMARSNLKDYEMAIKDCQKAIEINPEQPGFYDMCGMVYRDMKQYDLALKYHEKAISLNPGNKKFYKNMSLVYVNAALDSVKSHDYENIVDPETWTV